MNDEAQKRIAAMEQELVEERRARQALVETSVQLNSMLNLSELLRAIVGSATQLLQSETGSLMLLDEENIREVIAFPKIGQGYDPMMDAPSTIDEAQWKELGLNITALTKG